MVPTLFWVMPYFFLHVCKHLTVKLKLQVTKFLCNGWVWGIPIIASLLACTHILTNNVLACSTPDGRMARTCAPLF